MARGSIKRDAPGAKVVIVDVFFGDVIDLRVESGDLDIERIDRWARRYARRVSFA